MSSCSHGCALLVLQDIGRQVQMGETGSGGSFDQKAQVLHSLRAGGTAMPAHVDKFDSITQLRLLSTLCIIHAT